LNTRRSRESRIVPSVDLRINRGPPLVYERERAGFGQPRTHPASSEVARFGGPCLRAGGQPGLPGGRCSLEQVTGSSGDGEKRRFSLRGGARAPEPVMPVSLLRSPLARRSRASTTHSRSVCLHVTHQSRVPLTSVGGNRTAVRQKLRPRRRFGESQKFAERDFRVPAPP